MKATTLVVFFFAVLQLANLFVISDEETKKNETYCNSFCYPSVTLFKKVMYLCINFSLILFHQFVRMLLEVTQYNVLNAQRSQAC